MLIYDRANRRMRFINMFSNPGKVFERDVKPGEKNENNINAGNPD